MGNWWLAASPRQCTCSCIKSLTQFLAKHRNHPSDWTSLLPRFGARQLLAFTKIKITFEREEISDHRWDQENMTGQLMAVGRTVWGSWVPILKGTEASFSYVQLLVSCIFFNKCLYFHNTWLDTFWTDSYIWPVSIELCLIALPVFLWCSLGKTLIQGGISQSKK